MQTSGHANSYRHQNWPARSATFLLRRKWLLIVALVASATLVLVLTRRRFIKVVTLERDTYMDDVPEELYQEVLRRWYNVSRDAENEVNAGNAKMNDPTLLDEMRRRWIIWQHDPRKSYVLREPDLVDPSMGQAATIQKIFDNKTNGFFIECGAYDGETRSNTLVFERFFGWSGLLIEADPINFTKMLQKNRRAYLSPTCLSIQPRPMVASFLMARNVGRLHDAESAKIEGKGLPLKNTDDVAHTGVHIDVQCFPLVAYIRALNVTSVDYFSLDIEGNEIDVLETIPFDEVDIKTLSVEYIHNPKGRRYLMNLMEARGYYVHSFIERSDNLANDIVFVKRGT